MTHGTDGQTGVKVEIVIQIFYHECFRKDVFCSKYKMERNIHIFSLQEKKLNRKNIFDDPLL